ncbi:MAG TPA: GTPase ObgE [Fibrobacteria bacterium]|nr:GTPase ObgE [Fibrobacteria bacterium]
MFIDETGIEVLAGRGGNGCVAWRREKYVPRGGPSGGKGGRGGHVVLRASKDIHTLYDIGNTRIFRAEAGQNGMPSNCTGKDGEDVVVQVPVGTLVKELESRELLCDLKEDGQTFIAAEGGRGGLGNSAFKSSTHQTPTKALPGTPGQARRLSLELKLVADCGLVGFPNAGKSSIIRRLSAATPKVADYPFTTLKPSLGIVEVAVGQSFVLVDIPGLIEGAAEGKGLGHQFLRHVERSACLAFVMDIASEEPYSQYATLRGELEKFHPLLLRKPKLILLNKVDLRAADGGDPVDPRFLEEGCPVLLTSTVTGTGLEDFKQEVQKLMGDRGIRKQGW